MVLPSSLISALFNFYPVECDRRLGMNSGRLREFWTSCFRNPFVRALGSATSTLARQERGRTRVQRSMHAALGCWPMLKDLELQLRVVVRAPAYRRREGDEVFVVLVLED